MATRQLRTCMTVGTWYARHRCSNQGLCRQSPISNEDGAGECDTHCPVLSCPTATTVGSTRPRSPRIASRGPAAGGAGGDARNGTKAARWRSCISHRYGLNYRIARLLDADIAHIERHIRQLIKQHSPLRHQHRLWSIHPGDWRYHCCALSRRGRCTAVGECPASRSLRGPCPEYSAEWQQCARAHAVVESWLTTRVSGTLFPGSNGASV